jgi:aspartyl aminopeptidase
MPLAAWGSFQYPWNFFNALFFIMSNIPSQHAQAQDLLDFIDASPSPWHAVATAAQRLQSAGFHKLEETARWTLAQGGRYFVVRGGGSIIAFVMGQQAVEATGFRIVGAHTDSPGLRLKPRAAHACEGHVRLGVEVYGGPILATFADRDLSLAGRVNLRTAHGFETRLLRFEQPLVRLPNLAIHMNREVNEQGLKFNKQTELPVLLGRLQGNAEADALFLQQVAEALEVDAQQIINTEFNLYDTQKGSFWGAQQEFIADSQLDNLASCHAGLTALMQLTSPAATTLCALFDHEEVGSTSASGADGSFLADVLDRIGSALELDTESRRVARARSFFVSVDMAHAWHPNFPGAYEPQHKVLVNSGPVIKTNANQRYSSNAETTARFLLLCDQAGVPAQHYAHRTDLGCGSTIGPIVAANLGMPSIDVGNPMWAMHSIRESAGVMDHVWMIAVLQAHFAS